MNWRSSNGSCAARAVAVVLVACVTACSGEIPDSGAERSETKHSAVGDFPAAFGVAHAQARYNPYGAIQTAFVDGARDAHDLGIKVLKIWNGNEIKDPAFYFLSPGEASSYTDFSSALDLPTYHAVLDVPFKTVFFNADDATVTGPLTSALKTIASEPLTQTDKDRIYQTAFDFAVRLRKDFAGSGRTFVIQNHEGDWHIDPTSQVHADNDPLPVGLQNFRDYWTLRQQAVENARAAQPSDVKVYHMCEVVRVLPSLQNDAPSLTRDVLPHVACDLVGYSAYESALVSTAVFEEALAYVRSKALASPTFGTNQVAISEIGLPERNVAYSAAAKQDLASLIVSLVQRGLPYVLFWTLYDNGCTVPDCGQPGGVTSNVPEQNLMGYYVRKPDGSFGEIFSAISSQLAPQLKASACDPATQPASHYGEKSGACLPSCGQLGGTSASQTPCDQSGKVDAGTAYDVEYCCKESAGAWPSPSCDPTTHPAPHFGVKNGQCLPSCGLLAGTTASQAPCDQSGKVDAGNAYDVEYCCKEPGGPGPSTYCDPTTQPAHHYGVKNGQCLPSCGLIGGTVASTVPCTNEGLTEVGSAYDADYCCVEAGSSQPGSPPSPICDAASQPAPHYGAKNGQCLPSCGVLGGTYTKSVPCEQSGMADAGSAYDATYCCRSLCDPASQPAPHYGAKNGQCLPSCGVLGGTYTSPVPCAQSGMADAGSAYDAAYCCK